MSLHPDQTAQLDRIIADAEFCKAHGIPSIEQQQADALHTKKHNDMLCVWPFGQPAAKPNPY